jgi:endoglucanase
VHVSTGNASNAHWEKTPELRDRHTDVTFPIRWWSWGGTTVRFTPDYDGPVTLVLAGPWAADKNGDCQRQEVIWDDLTADGVAIGNGGFESREGGMPAAWTCPWAPYPGSDEWPLTIKMTLEGKHFAATWHNRPLQQVIQVKKGGPVSIRIKARAATPPGFTEPKNLGNNTPAHRAAVLLKRGVNFGNGWEADPSWKLKFTPADVDDVANEGFDHIRVPVAFHRHLQAGDSGMELSPALLADLEPVLRRAMDRKLAVLLDWHHFDDFTADPEKHLQRFVSGWECIARHFRDWPPGLFLELLNEPQGKLNTLALGPVYQKTIASIRTIDPKRIIVASPGMWGNAGELDQLHLPDNDDRIIVTIHCYEPFHFTHQGAGWVGLQDLKGLVYPGPPATPLAVPPSLKDNPGIVSSIAAYNTKPTAENPISAKGIRETLDLAVEWSKRFGRPVHLGEFGAHQSGDDASRARYLRDVRRLAEERKIPWTLWEWKAGFGYWNPQSNTPRFRKELIE